MRYLVGVLEALLAVALFATVASQLIGAKFGLVNLAGDLIAVALGLWLARKAIANLRTKSELQA